MEENPHKDVDISAPDDSKLKNWLHKLNHSELRWLDWFSDPVIIIVGGIAALVYVIFRDAANDITRLLHFLFG